MKNKRESWKRAFIPIRDCRPMLNVPIKCHIPSGNTLSSGFRIKAFGQVF